MLFGRSSLLAPPIPLGSSSSARCRAKGHPWILRLQETPHRIHLIVREQRQRRGQLRALALNDWPDTATRETMARQVALTHIPAESSSQAVRSPRKSGEPAPENLGE